MIGAKLKQIQKVKTLKTKKAKGFNKQKLLITKIIISCAFLISLIMIMFSSFSYVTSNINNTKKEISSLKEYSSKLEKTIKDIESKERTASKYIKIWNDLPENKKQTNGIQLSKIKNLLKDLTKEYNFKNINITAEAPTELFGVFAQGGISTSTILITIEFNTFFDTYAYKFTEETVKQLPGHAIIEEITIKKLFEIDDKYLLSANKNMVRLPIQAKIKIRLYGINNKNTK